MQVRNRENVVAGLIFLVLAAIVYFTIPGQIAEASFTEIGARFFPRFLSVLLMVMSVLLVLNGFLKSPDEESDRKRRAVTFSGEGRALITGLLILLNIILMPIIGFILSSILCIGAVMYQLKVRKWYFYLLHIILVFVIHFLFVKLMYVQLP